jgi:hypothetical protein
MEQEVTFSSRDNNRAHVLREVLSYVICLDSSLDAWLGTGTPASASTLVLGGFP